MVAEAPGAEEDRRNTQLIGECGQLLRKTLRKHGIDLDTDCWKTNAVICRPPNNKTPDDKQVAACLPNLRKTIEELNPRIIIPLGSTAVKAVIGMTWKEDVGQINRWVGFRIPSTSPNAWICPTYHPSYLLRANDPVLDLIFSNHLKAAFRRKRRPWEDIPNYKAQVEVELSPSRAARVIRRIRRTAKLVAFDYEGNMLKPDSKKAQIVSCSICADGARTIAYPWEGGAIDQTARLLRMSSIGKIASNIKFEDRWTRAKLGRPVRTWAWDTMLAAHVLDNRRGVTSIKFQSYVLLGAESYNDKIEPYLKSKGGSAVNRIRDINLQDLLLYNGLDSLLEYKVAMIQMRRLGHGPK